MIDPTIIGWQETWYGRCSMEIKEWVEYSTREIGYKISQQIELDIDKIVRNVILTVFKPLTYKDIQQIVKDLYFAFDPEDQVQWKGQKIYKTEVDIEDLKRQLYKEFELLRMARKINYRNERQQ